MDTERKLYLIEWNCKVIHLQAAIEIESELLQLQEQQELKTINNFEKEIIGWSIFPKNDLYNRNEIESRISMCCYELDNNLVKIKRNKQKSQSMISILKESLIDATYKANLQKCKLYKKEIRIMKMF